jgi:hypothetical protein
MAVYYAGVLLFGYRAEMWQWAKSKLFRQDSGPSDREWK